MSSIILTEEMKKGHCYQRVTMRDFVAFLIN